MCSWNSLDENTQSRFLFWIAHSYVEDSDNEPPAGLYFFLFDSSFSLFIRWIIRSTNYAIFYTVYEKNIEKIGKRETRSYYSTRYFLHPRIGERCAIPVRGNDFKRFQNISSSVTWSEESRHFHRYLQKCPGSPRISVDLDSFSHVWDSNCAITVIDALSFRNRRFIDLRLSFFFFYSCMRSKS